MQQLLALLNAAGHSDFRDARGPMGFTQRQAAGKFTRDEVAAFIEALEAAAEEGGVPEPAEPVARLSTAERSLRKLTDQQLASELQRRGWVVMEP